MQSGNTTKILTSADARSWTAVSTIPGVAVSALAYGNGKWIAAADSPLNLQSGSLIFESTDLRTWTKVADSLFHVGGIAYGDGRWVAVGTETAGVAVGGLEHADRVEYSSVDGTEWNAVDISELGNNDANMQQLYAVAYGPKKWIAAGIDERDDPTGQTKSALRLTTYTSADGAHWAAGTQWDADIRPTQSGGGTPTVVHGNERWVLGASAGGGGVHVRTSGDGAKWADAAGVQFGQEALEAMTYGDGTYLAAALAAGPQDGSASSSTDFYTSTDASVWKKVGTRSSFISAVAYGPAPSGPTTTTTTPPTSVSTTAVPCRNDSMWPAIKQVIAANTVPELNSVRAHCSGVWGYALFKMTATGPDLTVVVHWNAAVRVWESAQDACAQGEVPSDIRGQACTGTAPSASNVPPSTTTTAAASGSASAPPCTKATFQKLHPASTVASFWCVGDWAVVDFTNADSEGADAYRWDGTAWTSAQQFECDIPVPGMPAELVNKVCHQG